MRRGFHRKRIPVLGRGPKTRGTGFKYLVTVPPTARELTAEDVAAKETERQQQLALEEGRRLREWNVTVLVGVAKKILSLWKEATDYNDQRLVEFPGWTTANFCALPVDEDVALAYSEELAGRQLSLDEMDAVINLGFRNERVVSTAQIVEKATKSVRAAVEKCCDDTGISVERLVQVLTRRSARAKQDNIDLDSALAFVGKKMSSMFEALCKDQAA